MTHHDIDLATARVYAIPMTTRFRGITVREGMLIEGPAGWGEFCPFREYDDQEAAGWLGTAIEAATVDWPEPGRDRVPINCTVPAVGPERAHEIVSASGCGTAKVKVADHAASLGKDLARVEAVRDALGAQGAIQVDANGLWDVDMSARVIPQLDKAASGLQYVEQPCHTIDELAAVRRRVDVPIAAENPSAAPRTPSGRGGRSCGHRSHQVHPLGGVRRSCRSPRLLGSPAWCPPRWRPASVWPRNSPWPARCRNWTSPVAWAPCPCSRVTRCPGRSPCARSGHLPVLRVAPVPDPALLDTYAPDYPEQVAWWRNRLARTPAGR